MSEKETAEALRLLREHLSYDPATGNFTWIKSVGTKIQPGKRAGSADGGYCKIILKGKKYRAHRVAWAFSTNRWPSGQIDHINHDGLDNRLENLRDVPERANRRNKSLARNNNSGVNGVWLKRRAGRRPKWGAKIQVDSVAYHLGDFETFEAAVAARKAADIKFGFHKNHGK
ncbi:MAG: HNH endonuclease [Hyphomonas sp.]|nr:HNH endonuclease [Hyphomonas sp.]